MTERLGTTIDPQLGAVAVCEPESPVPTESEQRSLVGEFGEKLRSPFFRNFSQLVGATAAGQVLTVLASPALTRLYSPAEFGIYQGFVSLLIFASVLLTLRYEIAIPIAQHDRRAAHIVALAGILCCVIAAAILGGGWIYMRISSQSLLPELGFSGDLFIVLLSGSALLGGLSQVATYWGIRERDFGGIAGARAGQAAILTGGMLSLGFVRTGILGLLVADLVARLSAFSWLAARFQRRVRTLLQGTTTVQLSAVASRYRDFPRFATTGGLLNTAGFALTPLLILYVYGPVNAGLFALVDRILVAPSILVSNALSQLYAGELKHLRAAGATHTLGFVRRTLATLFGLGLLPFLAVAFFAPAIFPAIFGEAWSKAGEFAAVLALAHFIGFVVGPINATLPLLERQRWQFAWDLARVVVVVAGWFLAGWWGISVQGGLAIYTAAMTFFSVLYAWLSWTALRQEPRR